MMFKEIPTSAFTYFLIVDLCVFISACLALFMASRKTRDPVKLIYATLAGIFFPFLGLIYPLIMKKDVDKNPVAAEPTRDDDDYARMVFRQANIRMKLEEAVDRLRQGIITREEFEAEKEKILKDM